MLFDVTKDALKSLEVAKSWGNTILSKCVNGIVDVKVTKHDHPIDTTK